MLFSSTENSCIYFTSLHIARYLRFTSLRTLARSKFISSAFWLLVEDHKDERMIKQYQESASCSLSSRKQKSIVPCDAYCFASVTSNSTVAITICTVVL